MRVIATAKPCMLLETVELLYAYVNQLPACELTANGPYCIAEDAVQRIMEEACRGVDREDPELQFYFQQSLLQDESGEGTCIARNLAYNSMDLSCETLEEAVAALEKGWQTLRINQEHAAAISMYCVEYAPSSVRQYRTLGQELEKLSVTAAYRQKLLEAFSGFEYHARRLGQLLAPVAEKLETLLQPWAEQAQALCQEWQDFFSLPDWPERLESRSSLSALNAYDVMNIRMRYLQSAGAPGKVDEQLSTVYFHMGVSRSVKPGNRGDAFAPWEYRALRLLGRPARMKMLQAMLAEPMTSREMAQRLDLHLGAVGRDVGSMFDARLLIVEFNNGRNRYKTNAQSLRTIAEHILRMVDGIPQ